MGLTTEIRQCKPTLVVLNFEGKPYNSTHIIMHSIYLHSTTNYNVQHAPCPSTVPNVWTAHVSHASAYRLVALIAMYRHSEHLPYFILYHKSVFRMLNNTASAICQQSNECRCMHVCSFLSTCTCHRCVVHRRSCYRCVVHRRSART